MLDEISVEIPLQKLRLSHQGMVGNPLIPFSSAFHLGSNYLQNVSVKHLMVTRGLLFNVTTTTSLHTLNGTVSSGQFSF